MSNANSKDTTELDRQNHLSTYFRNVKLGPYKNGTVTNNKDITQLPVNTKLYLTEIMIHVVNITVLMFLFLKKFLLIYTPIRHKQMSFQHFRFGQFPHHQSQNGREETFPSACQHRLRTHDRFLCHPTADPHSTCTASLAFSYSNLPFSSVIQCLRSRK